MKILKRLLLCSMFVSAMSISMIPASIYAGTGEGNEGTPPSTEQTQKKAELKNLQVIAKYNFQRIEFTDFELQDNSYMMYQINVEDLIENGKVDGNYKIKYENKSNGVFRFQPQSQDVSNVQFTDVHEGSGIGWKDVNCISLQPLKKGTGTLEVTITDLNDTSNYVVKSIQITVSDKKAIVEEEENVSVSSVTNIFENQEIVNRIYSMIKNDKVTSPMIKFNTKGAQSSVKMPKEILQAVKEQNKPLTVELLGGLYNNGITWNFPSVDKVLDIDLNINITSSKEMKIDGMSENNMVLDFSHHGELPTGATVKIYVGNKFNVGDKITLAYYNDVTKKLEDAKEYVVGNDYYITFAIPHCSSYIAQTTTDYNKIVNSSAPESKPTPDNTPITPESKPTPDSNKVVNTSPTPKTGDHTNLLVFASSTLLSGIILIAAFKKLAKSK